jgi:hypothetical protein
VDGAAAEAVRAFLRLVAVRARAHASGGVLQARTGTLARSIRVFVRASRGGSVLGRLRVSRRAFYGTWHEFGLPGPWEIRPRPGRRREAGERGGRHPALRFVSRAGQLTFRVRVEHPGLRARHWLESAYRATLPGARPLLERAVDEALRA